MTADDSDVAPGIRAQLASLARRSKCRTSEWSVGSPTEWAPYQVLNPESGIPFSGPGAWRLVVNLLESGEPLQEVTLSHPPGAKAYVMLVRLDPAGPEIYIKIQLGRGKIIGRSFHYSYGRDLTGEPDE